jgi:hypothetical protein
VAEWLAEVRRNGTRHGTEKSLIRALVEAVRDHDQRHASTADLLPFDFARQIFQDACNCGLITRSANLNTFTILDPSTVKSDHGLALGQRWQQAGARAPFKIIRFTETSVYGKFEHPLAGVKWFDIPDVHEPEFRKLSSR